VANNSVTQTVDGMQVFLTRWAENRAETAGDGWDGSQDIEQGLVAFQTLLESHTDIAFDFFELWSLRNIFAIPADLPVVAPHHKGLDLDSPLEEEQELIVEIAELRRKIDDQRRLKRLYTCAVRKSNLQLKRSRARLDHIAFLRSPQLHTFNSLPDALTMMYKSVSALPAHDPASFQLPLPDPGKRPWETSKTGYLNWAVGQLLVKTRDTTGREGSAAVGKAVEDSYGIGTSEHVKAALELESAKDTASWAQASQDEDAMEL